MARVATLAARWLHELQPINILMWSWGFLTARDGIDRGDHCFRPRVVGVVGVWKEFSSGDKTSSSLSAAGVDVGQRGNSCRALPA